MKLTVYQAAILKRMARRNEDLDGPISGPELSWMMDKRRSWAGPKLDSLAKLGLVKELGLTMTGGRCFSITDAGRKALEDSE